MAAPEPRFISLAEIVRPSQAQATVEAPPIADVLPPVADVEREPLHADEDIVCALAAARRFSASLAATFEAMVSDLLRDLAADVLARELQLAPVDIATIARRLVCERLADGPVHLRISPADREAAFDLPVVVDPALEPGDAVLECAHGGIDARLGVRLADVLAGGRA